MSRIDEAGSRRRARPQGRASAGVLRRWGARVIAAAALAGALAIAPAIVLGKDDRLDRLRAERARAERAIREREADNAEKRRRVHALKNDPASVEDIARSELGLTFPGELVIQVEPGR